MTTGDSNSVSMTLKKPTTTAEFVSAVREAVQGKLRAVIAGSSSQPLAGAQQTDGRLVQNISTIRYNKVVEHSISDMTITVQAGMTLGQLQQHLGWQNQWLPIDPPAIAGRDPMQRTIGGLLATNTLGPLRFANGDECGWRTFLLGLSFVDGKGQLIKAGGRTVKNVAGYALHRLMIGSQGTLGALAEITLRTFARPADEQALVVYCNSAAEAEEVLASALNADVVPAYVQAISGKTFAANPLELPTAPVVLIFGFLDLPAICTAQIGRLRDLNSINRLDSIAQMASPSARLRLWMTREPTGAHPFRIFTTSSQVTTIISKIESLADSLNGKAFIIAEAGSGQIRGVFTDVPTDSQGNIPDTMNDIASRHGGLLHWPQMLPTPSALYGRIKSALDPEDLFPRLSAMQEATR